MKFNALDYNADGSLSRCASSAIQIIQWIEIDELKSMDWISKNQSFRKLWRARPVDRNVRMISNRDSRYSMRIVSRSSRLLWQRCQRTSLQIENQNWLIQFEPLPASCWQCIRIAFVRFRSISQDCSRLPNVRKETFASVRLFGMPA